MPGLGLTLGAVALGIFLNTYLYGIVSYQYMAYANTKFGDPYWIKSIVLVLFLIDTAHSASLIHMAWYYMIAHFGDFNTLADAIWVYPFTAIVTSFVACLTQLFLGFRIWRLTKNSFIYGFIAVIAVSSLALGVTCTVKASSMTSVLQFRTIDKFMAAWLSTEVAADVIISTALIHALLRSRTGFQTSDTVINHLMRTAVQTGALCGIFSTLTLVMFLATPETQLFGLFGLPMSRLYSTTLMDTLLCRKYLRGLFGQQREAMKTFSRGGLRLQVLKEIETELKFDDAAESSQTAYSKGHRSFEQ
ncbi:unnamed protein product [Cyclocybe aegerita]|uniref:DUF6534 domain-containing protein n=1 Tax=Cyclocybe aegerita TaxID=1973307 RepID=A0A8S0WGY8_CYCAE|nr:unnamed protein product [Cyclocybe aegerita]